VLGRRWVGVFVAQRAAAVNARMVALALVVAVAPPRNALQQNVRIGERQNHQTPDGQARWAFFNVPSTRWQ
jgi:hypothetical protein